jgi:hypothetical protein
MWEEAQDLFALIELGQIDKANVVSTGVETEFA